MSTEERIPNNLPGRRAILAALLIVAAVAAFAVSARNRHPDDISTGPLASSVPSAPERSLRAIESLPPTAAGPADASAPRQARPASQSPQIEYLHFTKLHLASLASLLVDAKHLWIGLLESQGDAFAHDAHGIDGIHQRFDGRFKQVTFSDFDHASSTSWALR